MKKLKKVNAIKIAVVILLIAVGLLILGPRKTIKVSYDPIVYYGDDYNITVVLNGTWSRSEKSFITTNHCTGTPRLGARDFIMSSSGAPNMKLIPRSSLSTTKAGSIARMVSRLRWWYL